MMERRKCRISYIHGLGVEFIYFISGFVIVYTCNIVRNTLQRRSAMILLNSRKKFNAILESAFFRAVRVFLLLPRVENTIDPATTGVNFPRLTYILTDVITKDDIYRRGF